MEKLINRKQKINYRGVEKHIIVLGYETPLEFCSPIKILVDGIHVGDVHFDSENYILFLDKINLEEHKLHRKGIGTIIIKYIEEHFISFADEGPILFLVQYDKKNTSKEFYKKQGFRDFEKAKEFSREEKNRAYFYIDPFCEDFQILYKVV